MRRLVAYLRELGTSGLTHDDVEQLIRGTGPANETEPDLAEVMDAIRAASSDPVTRPDLISTLAQTASRPALRTTRPRRVLAVGVAAAAIFALAGVAAAADSAYPGHPLHGIDKALEMFGIGDGGPAERLVEVQVLLDHGKIREAEAQLESEFTQPAAETGRAVVDIVGDKKHYIEGNKGNSDGVDGRDFGAGVVERTPGHLSTPPGQEKEQENVPTETDQSSQTETPSVGKASSQPAERSNETGPPDQVGPPEGAGRPDHAGPKEPNDN